MNKIFRICPKCIMFIRENDRLTAPSIHQRKDTCHACQAENVTTMPMQIKVETEQTETGTCYRLTEKRTASNDK